MDVAHLINSNTCRKLCISFGAEAMSRLQAVKSKISDSKGLRSADLQNLIVERTKVMQEVREVTSWIVVFFNQDQLSLSLLMSDLSPFAEFIEASSYRKEVLFELSKNQPMYQVPDSEVASLQLAINYILSIPEDSRPAPPSHTCSRRC